MEKADRIPDFTISGGYKYLNEIDIVILSCGQLARTLAYKLWELPYKFHCIDMGSIFEPFDGKRNRTWHYKLDIENIIKNYEK